MLQDGLQQAVEGVVSALAVQPQRESPQIAPVCVRVCSAALLQLLQVLDLLPAACAALGFQDGPVHADQARAQVLVDPLLLKGLEGGTLRAGNTSMWATM